MSYLNAQNPADLRAAVNHRLRSDPNAAYYAEYAVESCELVANLVPTRNVEAMQENAWLRREAAAYGTLPIADFDPIDPAYVIAWLGLSLAAAEPLQSIMPISSAPGHFYCAHCQDMALTRMRLEPGYDPVRKVVRPVLLPYGVRVIEILLCAPCVDALGVEAS